MFGEIIRRLNPLTSDAAREAAIEHTDDNAPPSSLDVANAAAAAEQFGVLPYAGVTNVARNGIWRAWIERISIRDRINSSNVPYLVIDPRPGLHIVDANQHYATATTIRRKDMRGRKLFDVFPDNPGDPAADGVSKLYRSLCLAAQTRETNAMTTQRYDVPDGRGGFTERYWSPANTPIYDADGRLLYLLHHVRDVTSDVLKAREATAGRH